MINETFIRIIRWFALIVGAMTVGCLIDFCAKRTFELEIIKVPKTEIESLYFHEKGIYSVSRLTSGKVLITHRLPRNGVVVVVDAVEYPWYECDYTRDEWTAETTGACYVHIKDINGMSTGSWNHGKFGTGYTNRIQ